MKKNGSISILRKILFSLVALMVFFLVVEGKLLATTTTEVSVTVIREHEIQIYEYYGVLGSNLNIDFDVLEDDINTFSYYLYHGEVIENKQTSFYISKSTDIIVVIENENDPVIVYLDTNGRLLEINEEPLLEGLTKPGYEARGFVNHKDKETVKIVDYVLTNENIINITVSGGIATPTNPIYNEVVTLTPNDISNFSYWSDDLGNIVSTNPSHQFTALIDNSLKAVYDPNFNKENYIYLQDVSGIRQGHKSYLGYIDIKEELDIVEYGILASNRDEVLTLDSNNVEIIPSTIINVTNEFLRSIKVNTFSTIRAYAILSDGSVIYSDNNIVHLEEVLAYSAGFEDASKSAFAKGMISSNEVSWTLDEALIGTLESDKKINNKSVRFRPNGFAKIEQGFKYLTKVEFMYAHYGTNTTGLLSLEVSKDNTNWYRIWQMPQGQQNDLLNFTVTINYDELEGVDKSDELSIKFIYEHTSNSPRMNLDDVKIYQEILAGPEIVDNTAPVITLSQTYPNGGIKITPGESFILPSFEAIDNIDGNITNLVTVDDSSIEEFIQGNNEYHITEEGIYNVVLFVEDSSGNYEEVVIIIIVTTEIDVVYTGYYEGITGLMGTALVEELRIILNSSFNSVSYDDARFVLAKSDQITVNGETWVHGIYDSDKIATYWIGTGDGSWQREHVWPNSKLGIERVSGSSRNQGSDLHNLRAITGINQSRSNRYFVDGMGEAKTVGASAFYPGDEHKGDVARILFYMTVMYDFLELTNDETKLINNPTTNYKLEGAYQGLLSVLLQWHIDDPVDDFERSRNEFIYSGVVYNQNNSLITPQGNRNPFIDHPELAQRIWVN